MTTLIASYNSDGCVGRCDAKCYEATTPGCECICGGKNHGTGQAKAIENTRQFGKDMMREWAKAHPDTVKFEWPAGQEELF